MKLRQSLDSTSTSVSYAGSKTTTESDGDPKSVSMQLHPGPATSAANVTIKPHNVQPQYSKTGIFAIEGAGVNQTGPAMAN